MTAFEELGVLPELGRVMDELGWKLPSAIQHEAIPLILGGGDVLMAAETRSGKTGALCLSIVQLVWEALKGIQKGDIRIGLGARSWTLSNTDRGKGLAVSADGLTCQARELKKWHGCRATTGVWGDGKYYYEATVVDEGLCRVGWSTEKASLELGTDEFGYGYGGMGQKSHRKQFRTYGGKYGQSDVIGCLLDLDNSQISFKKNGKNLGVAFEINETDKGHTNFFPAVFLKNAEMAFNFGETEFKFPVPEGFVPVFDAPPGKVTLNPNTVCESTFQLPKPPNNAPQTVIVAPTRESAEQIFNQIQMFQKYLKDPEVRALLLIGGVDLDEQLKVLQRGVDIVVATVGRLDDLIANGTIMLSSCRVFVLDDVDALLRCGYMEVIERMHKKIPKITTDGQRLQMVICSGTLDSEEVRKLPERLMHFPTWVDLKESDVVPETVHHVVYMIDPYKDQSWHHWSPTTIQTDKVHALDDVGPGTNTPEALSEAVKRLKGEYALNVIKLYEIDRAIIYCRTKLDCDNMERFLRQALGTKYSFACLHRDRNSRERKVNVAKFRNEQLDFLISTDVATRGIDVSEEPRDHKRMKHVDIRYNFIREKLQDGTFKIKYISTTEQLADLFTKGLPRGPFEMLRSKLGLHG
nr:ATP-dependent RNA helicase Ddx1 [Aedes albopictus]